MPSLFPPLNFRRRMSTFGVAFDIDGVLYRGTRVIPSAKFALLALRERKIPFVLLTNGGGATYAEKAAIVTDRVGVKVNANEVGDDDSRMMKFLIFNGLCATIFSDTACPQPHESSLRAIR
jgi:ribonucleotide monophosphatase NagD (HAD superfamily)